MSRKSSKSLIVKCWTARRTQSPLTLQTGDRGHFSRYVFLLLPLLLSDLFNCFLVKVTVKSAKNVPEMKKVSRSADCFVELRIVRAVSSAQSSSSSYVASQYTNKSDLVLRTSVKVPYLLLCKTSHFNSVIN